MCLCASLIYLYNIFDHRRVDIIDQEEYDYTFTPLGGIYYFL